MMATRSFRPPDIPAFGSGADERVRMNGTWCTETIKASGHMTPRKQAVHMTATDHVIKTEKSLAKTGPSTHDPKRAWP